VTSSSVIDLSVLNISRLPLILGTSLKELYEFVGGFGGLLIMGHEWKPLDKWQKSLKLLKEEVIPNI